MSVRARTARQSWLACLFLVFGCSESETSIGALQLEAPSSETREPALPNVPLTKTGLPKVAFLGDGIAAGRFIDEQRAFPYLVQRQLRARGADFTLINASVSGDTTEDALRRVDWILKQAPKIVVIELGASDSEQALPAATVEANLRAIISKVRAAQARPLLLGLSIVPAAYAERSSALAYAQSLEAIYPSLAAELDVPFVPNFLQGVIGRKELTLPDGVHPTPDGHERVASNIQPSLRRLLAE